MNWVVKIAGQMFDAPETVALVRALTKLQKQPLFYLAYPRAILTRPRQMPGQIRIVCPRTEFLLVKAQV